MFNLFSRLITYLLGLVIAIDGLKNGNLTNVGVGVILMFLPLDLMGTEK